MRRVRFVVGGKPAVELTECLLLSSAEDELDGSALSGGAGDAAYEPPVMDGLFDGMVIMSACIDDVDDEALPTALQFGAPAPAPAPASAPQPSGGAGTAAAALAELGGDAAEPASDPDIEALPDAPPDPGAAAAAAPAAAPRPSGPGRPAAAGNTVQMVVPPGAKAGEVVTLETEQGEKISMALPAGAAPGATVQFRVQTSFWDNANAVVGQLGSAAAGMLSSFLTGPVQAAPVMAPPPEQRKATLASLVTGTLLCVPGCSRLRRLEGACQLPLAAGELEIFATADRSAVCFDIRPEVMDDEDEIAASEKLRKELVGNIPSNEAAYDLHGNPVSGSAAKKKDKKKKEGDPLTLEEQAVAMKELLAVALAESAAEEQKARNTAQLTTVALHRKPKGGELGMVISEGGRVMAVGAGTVAAAAGVVPGSAIRAVQGRETRGKKAIIAAIQQAQRQLVPVMVSADGLPEPGPPEPPPLELSLALPPPPTTATLKLLDRNSPAVALEVEEGEFHFLCSDRSQAVCIVLPLGSLQHGVCEQLRQVLTQWLGPAGLLTRFGEAAREAQLAKVKAEQAPAASVRKGLFSMMKAADMVVASARAAEQGVADGGGASMGGLLKGAMAGVSAAQTVRKEQESDPLRRLLPIDWADLPVAYQGAMTLLQPAAASGAAGGGGGGGGGGALTRLPCHAVLKLRGTGAEGWLTLFDKASVAAQQVRDGGGGGLPPNAEAARNAVTFAKLGAMLDEASRWAEALSLYEQAIDAGDAELRRIIALATPPKPKPGQFTHPSQMVAATMLTDSQRHWLLTNKEEVSLRRTTCADRAMAIRAALGAQAPAPYLAAVGSMAQIAVQNLQEQQSAEAGAMYMANRVAFSISMREIRTVSPAVGLMHGISLDQRSESALRGAGEAGLNRVGAPQVIVAQNAAACASWTETLAALAK